MITAVWIAGVILLIADIVVTIRLFLNRTCGVNQKLAQTAIVWFLPFAGALIVWHFLRDEDEKPTRRGSVSDDVGYIDEIRIPRRAGSGVRGSEDNAGGESSGD